MKLMTYNILDGAINTLLQVIEIVNQTSPDFLTLNEANTFAENDHKLLEEFADKTNFSHFEIALSGEGNYHVAVFSKFPFIETKKLQPLSRACLITTINSPFGLLSVASLHLSPFSEDTQHGEIDLIVNAQKEYPNRILMGDLNSLSRIDKYDEKIIDKFNEAQRKKFTKDGELRYDAIDKILSVGYFDPAIKMDKNMEPTVPTAANKDNTHGNMRLDYIFLSESLMPHLLNYSVIRTKLTDQASDHYPVTIELA